MLLARTHLAIYNYSVKNALFLTATLKVLYLTDTVAAVYHCVYEQPDGTCHPSAVISHILSRDPSIQIEEEDYIKSVLQRSCISIDHWKPVTGLSPQSLHKSEGSH